MSRGNGEDTLDFQEVPPAHKIPPTVAHLGSIFPLVFWELPWEMPQPSSAWGRQRGGTGKFELLLCHPFAGVTSVTSPCPGHCWKISQGLRGEGNLGMERVPN